MCYYSLANEVAKGYSNATLLPLHPCEHSRINILQWILTKLGTYLVLKRIWNPIDFQGHRVKFLGEGIRHTFWPLFIFGLQYRMFQQLAKSGKGICCRINLKCVPYHTNNKSI